jgi:molybdopterin/thiamine biosynthesis adenylyltransferase
VDEKDAALREIDEALLQRGFKRDWTKSQGHVWRGRFTVANLDVPISITIKDLNFVDLPEIAVVDRNLLPRRPIPHLYTDDGICYLNKATIVLDRYKPAGTVLACLERTQKVLQEALLGHTDEDFAGEFTAYWKGTVYVDLPDEFDQPTAQIYWLALDEANPTTEIGVIAAEGGIAEALLVRHRKIGGKQQPRSEPCVCFRINQRMTLVGGDWPPKNLAIFTKWLSHYTDRAEEILRSVVALPGRKVLLLQATNGYFLAEIVIPPAYQTKDFATRSDALPRVMTTIADKLTVRRFAGYRIDAEYVYGRNMHGRKNLAGKKIALIGCGTIGGFLAHALAESGAGALGGELHLFDYDVLQTSNLGRHVLGVPYLGKPKAEAVRSFLIEQLPHVAVKAHVADALAWIEPLLRFDFAIDATGEEALSIALNHEFHSRRPSAPPTLFIWLAGNGVAAQAILCADKSAACFKCLKPELSGPLRFPLLRDQTEIVVLPCDEGGFVPFPVTRSMQAAALAAEMALDWVNEHPRPYFRTRIFDEKKTYSVKDGNPDPSKSCPLSHTT